MENWSKTAMISYKRWRNPELRDELHFVGEIDEDQGTDNEICTIASAAPKTGGDNSASGSGSNKDTFTIDDALDAVGFGKSQLKVCLITGLAWIGDAMEMMILSILGPQLHCEWRLPSYKVAAITAVVFVGMGIGSPAWGSVSNNFGRKACLVICMSWTLFYGLLSAFSPVYSWLLVLRGLVGIGIGGAPQSVTMYSEFLPAKARGANIILIGAFWSIGAVLEVLLALWIMPTLGWRWLLGLSTIPMAIFVCLCYWLPESPRFEALTGRREKALATLSSIAKENGKALPPGKLAAYKQTDRGTIKDLFNAQYWKTTVLLWFIWFSFAFCYYGIVLLTTELFQAGDACGAIQGNKIEPSCSLECNYLTSADYKDLLWTTLAEFPGLLIVLLLVDRIGRKKSLALGFFMFSLCILPLYACIGRVTLTILIFLARAFISGGYQVAFVYTPEVFPTESRALAIGTSSAIARLGALVTPFVAQVLLRTSVYLSLTLYITCGLLAGVASLLLPIETLGRCLQESNLDQEAGESTSNSQTDGNTHSS